MPCGQWRARARHASMRRHRAAGRRRGGEGADAVLREACALIPLRWLWWGTVGNRWGLGRAWRHPPAQTACSVCWRCVLLVPAGRHASTLRRLQFFNELQPRQQRPVLKHGPWSVGCWRVGGWQTRLRSESEECVEEWGDSSLCSADTAGRGGFSLRSQSEPAPYDPKEFELFLGRARPRETLVEARRCPNVKIGNQTQVKRR